MKVALLWFTLLYSKFTPNPSYQPSSANLFRLNIHFVIAFTQEEWKDGDVEIWIKNRIKEAEAFFKMSPSLKIDYSFERKLELNGQSLEHFVFETDNDFHSFMNRHFDVCTEGKGYLPVLVAKQLKIQRNNKRLCGKAFLPSNVRPFSRKHGIALKRYCDPSRLAHELGHVFSLKHTYEPMVFRQSCHLDFPKGDKGKTKSADRTKKTINLMDIYIRGYQCTLNRCQKKLAAKQRKRYMNGDGTVNYRRIGK